MTINEAAELSKSELAQKVVALTNAKAKDKTATDKKVDHIGRAVSRKVGLTEGASENGLLEYLLKSKHPKHLKWTQVGSAIVKNVASIPLDVYGYEKVASGLDVSAAVSLGAAIPKMVSGRKPKTPPTQGATGEVWPANTLASGRTPGAEPAPGRQGRRRQHSPLQRFGNRPFLSLLRNSPRLRKGMRWGLRSQGFDPGDDNLQALADAADKGVEGQLVLDEVTGEWVELLPTGEYDPQTEGSLLEALKALRKLADLMKGLEDDDYPGSSAGVQLDDEELIVGAFVGAIDPMDALHVATSGWDDGIYLDSDGKEWTADGVRQQVGEMLADTGKLRDRIRARKSRRKARKKARHARQQRRLQSKAKRHASRQQRRYLKKDTHLLKREGRQDRKTAVKQAKKDDQVAENEEKMAELEAQQDNFGESGVPEETATDLDNAAIESDDAFADSEDVASSEPVEEVEDFSDWGEDWD